MERRRGKRFADTKVGCFVHCLPGNLIKSAKEGDTCCLPVVV